MPESRVSFSRLIARVASGIALGVGCVMQSIAILSSEDQAIRSFWAVGIAVLLAGMFMVLGTLTLKCRLIAAGASLGALWYLTLAIIQATEANAGRAEWVSFVSSLTLVMLYLLLAVMNLPPFVPKRTDIWSPDGGVPDEHE